ncbi:transcriptional regulator with XRE-family HTH domain [Fontibacillus phaseoli]|uniref:Transcriptional regulator with XRE-family HTH domain n=1 Tax=Fontibacillus phaseoli TaxID=1416533 RepID=A0A369BQM3_9BACL|nr:helix-turn-helix transcriptional regulator [Fontibacillus phaseoli]RCX22896.1 transcriptional regulator with XRE-family HTH domain [Fontibacillus phaseoli]
MQENLLGEFIREKRQELGFTVRDIAEKAEISFSQWSKLERGLVKDPTDETLEKVSYAINVDKESIFALAGRISPEVDISDYIQQEKSQFYYDLSKLLDSSVKVLEESRKYMFKAAPLLEQLFDVVAVADETKDLNDSEKLFIAREIESAFKLSVKRLKARRDKQNETD